MPFGMGPYGWAYFNPYVYFYAYPYGYFRGWGLPWYWGAAPYWSPWAPIPKEQEIAMLQQEASFLERQLAEARKRLEELQK